MQHRDDSAAAAAAVGFDDPVPMTIYSPFPSTPSSASRTAAPVSVLLLFIYFRSFFSLHRHHPLSLFSLDFPSFCVVLLLLLLSSFFRSEGNMRHENSRIHHRIAPHVTQNSWSSSSAHDTHSGAVHCYCYIPLFRTITYCVLLLHGVRDI